MKTPKKNLALLLAAVLVLTGASGAFAGEAPRPVETPEDALAWISALLGEDPDAEAWLLTDQMNATAAAAGGMKGLAASLAALGTLSETGAPYEGTLQGYRVFYVPCVFSVMPIDLIVVTEQGAVAGLTTGPYTGNREQAAPSAAFDEIGLALEVPSLGELPGTLTVPKGEGPFPAVVLVHGSGPNDRDETLVGQKPFRDLAEGLAGKGIAVYRYDKRTYVYGARLQVDRGITLMEETVEDAAAAVRLLSLQDRIDPDRIFVLGHSLGGNAVPAVDRLLRAGDVPVRGYILMAASPRPLHVLMREQAEYLYSLLPEITPEQQGEKDALLRDLDRLEDPDVLTENDMIAGAWAPYWKWLAAYDPLSAAAEIAVPCLLLQGEEDYQVTMTDFGIWKDAFGGSGNWRFISYPGLTHAFTPGEKREGSAAYARNEKVDARVIDDIAAFVLEAER